MIKQAQRQVIINTDFRRTGNIRESASERNGETTDITVTLSIEDSDTVLSLNNLEVDGNNATTLELPVTFIGRAFATKSVKITEINLVGKVLLATYNSSEYPSIDGRQIYSWIGEPLDLSSVESKVDAANVALTTLTTKSDAVKAVVDTTGSTVTDIYNKVTDDSNAS